MGASPSLPTGPQLHCLERSGASFDSPGGAGPCSGDNDRGTTLEVLIKGRECAQAIYEPCYETGKTVRWRIGTADGKPFAIAGLWRAWNGSDGFALSFTMLTTANADHHPLMRRFHKPGDEKRSVIILPPTQYEKWLGCRDPELARTFFRPPQKMK